MRNAVSHLEDCRNVVEKDVPVYGLKGPSVLQTVPTFDPVNSFVFEYMHCVQGICRSLLSLWLDTCNCRNSYYLGRHLLLSDKELSKIEPPNEITRLPNSLSSRKYWKASEYRSFILYYGPILLKGKLPAPFYNHFMILSWVLYHVLQPIINSDKLPSIEKSMQTYVKSYAKLYGEEYVTYNVHQLLHIIECVHCWGPVWAYSAYAFEAMNHSLLKMKHGTQHTAMQVADAWVCSKSVRHVGNKCMPQACTDVLNLHKKLIHRGGYLHKVKKQFGNIRVYGKMRETTLNNSEAVAVSILLKRNIESGRKVQTFFRFSTPVLTVHSEEYKNNAKLKRTNTLIQTDDNSYGVVKKLIVFRYCTCEKPCECNNFPTFIVQICKAIKPMPKYSKHIHQLSSDYATNVKAIFLINCTKNVFNSLAKTIETSFMLYLWQIIWKLIK